MRKKPMMLQMSKKNLMNFMKSLYSSVVLNVVDMMSLYSSVECCRHDENDWSKHGFEKRLTWKCLHVKCIWCGSHLKHKFDGYIHEK